MASLRVALITGSGKRRIGRAVAEALATKGFALALHYHTSAAEAVEAVAEFQSQGIAAAAFQADLTDEQAARGLVQNVLAHYGRIDVLVNAAAVWKAKRFEEIRAADLRRNFEANVLGTFLCPQEAGLAMTKQTEGGCIINFGDWAEARPYPDYADYFATKGAVPVLTRCLALELGSRNPRIRVNCILPGPVLFPDDVSESERQKSVQGTLVQHAGRPQNVAEAVLFFVENDFVTGVCLPVDGGRTIYANGF